MENKGTIEYLAYLLDKAKKGGQEKAIVFIGAGVSVSAGIPLTKVIVRHIRLKFIKNPIIRGLLDSGEDDYYSLMGALTADERRDLFHFYVTRDKVKLNIANVYLAQLLKLGYVDYIVTVNFDDLILKACTLYNFLPPVYDFSNIKTITTTDIRTGSVLYLHGQYFGQWLLNNKDELDKVEKEILSLFNAIKTRRTWVILGYSGSDEIFEVIKSLGSFSNELFWVNKKLNPEYDKHVIDFLEIPTTNAHRIEGHYADTFFLKLHAELQKLDEHLSPPNIFYKPFTHVKSIMQNVSEVDSTDDLSKQVTEMVQLCNARIDNAINQIENIDSIETLKQTIIDAILSGDFSDELANHFSETIAKNNYVEVNKQLGWYFHKWGIKLYDLATEKGSEELYIGSINKLQQAVKLNAEDYSVYSNWGNVLLGLGKLKEDKKLISESFEKYKTASEIDPQAAVIYSNWVSAILDMYHFTNEVKYLDEALINGKKAVELGGSSYNLACVYALKKENDSALMYLKESLINSQITIEHIEQDDDWSELRNKKEFKELIDKHK